LEVLGCESSINWNLRIIAMMVYESFIKAKQKGQKQFAVLVDPDKAKGEHLYKLISKAQEAGVDFFFVGGSLLLQDKLDYCLDLIKTESNIPAVLFPGNAYQLNAKADAILFLSLISGRNPDLLIGQHVVSAPYLKNSGLEIISTGYMLIDGGVPTAVSYMSNTNPIPGDKAEIAISTAMAGEMLGLKVTYMDAGSGARYAIGDQMIHEVRKAIEVPLIVGGGIRSSEMAERKLEAGADVIVVGNALEKDPELISDISQSVHQFIKSKSELDWKKGS